jgi:predicted phosphoadenosine phosphosulfate sulfurtransferase
VGVSTASFAERVFQALDQTSKPELLLVSIRADENAERFPACVEPEQDFWIHSEHFNDVPAELVGLGALFPRDDLTVA